MKPSFIRVLLLNNSVALFISARSEGQRTIKVKILLVEHNMTTYLIKDHSRKVLTLLMF